MNYEQYRLVNDALEVLKQIKKPNKTIQYAIQKLEAAINCGEEKPPVDDL